jgi:hypothetical protein
MLKYSNGFFKAVIVLSLIAYMNFSEITIFSNKVCGILTLVFSLLFLYKSKNKLPIFLIAFFILYCNYSIVVGEYLIGGSLGVPMQEVKTVEYYGINIRILLLFMSIVSLFLTSKKVKIDAFKITPRDNIVAFYGSLFALLLILIFGIKRGVMTSYTVSITPVYEYSTLFFFFAYYFSGKSILRKNLIISLIVIFILQDFHYGGRVTSIQLILLLLLTINVNKLSVKLILIGGSIGIFINTLIGAYRASYSLDSSNVLGIFGIFIGRYFVFDTPIYAFYSSATHIAAAGLVDIQQRFNLFFDFFLSIFIGNKTDTSDVTRFVSVHYFYNVGGGLITSNFYFWFGWIGVICIAILLVLILNKLGTGKSDYWKMVTIIIIFSVPRWYLYTPLSLIRPLLLISVLFLVFKATHHVLFKLAGKRTVINQMKNYVRTN